MAAIAGWLWPREGPFGGTDAGGGPLAEVSLTILLDLVFPYWAVRRLTKRRPGK